MSGIPEVLAVAIQHHQAGRLPEAEAGYRQILQVQPDHPDALNNLGNILQLQGRFEAAVVFYRQLVSLRPDCAEAHHNMAGAFYAQGKLEDAAEHYQQALAIKADYAGASLWLGRVLQEQGRHEEAVACYQRALALGAANADIFYKLGVALWSQGKQEEAIAAYQQALALKPDFAEAHNNLGNVYREQGRLEEATRHYQQALNLKPDLAEAYSNLGTVLGFQGRFEEAWHYLQRALALKPDDAEAHASLGTVLGLQGRFEEAEHCFQRALALTPDDPEVHADLIFMMYHRADTKAIAKGWKEWDDRHARPLAAQIKPHQNDRDPNRRLRVGYVSADFRAHAISYFFEPLLAAHDRVAVEVFCYSNSNQADGTTKRLQASADIWRNIARLNDEAAAKLIHGDRIDVLVDLSGHTLGNRLLVFARKPAPVQVTYLGSLTTTGVSAIDCRLSDRFLTPADTMELFSEKLIRLPGCFACYRPPERAPAVTSLPASANGYVTFGSFNGLGKVTPHVAALWSHILRLLPESRLILKGGRLMNRVQRERYLDLFQRNGIEADRLELLPWTALQDYLATYGRVDIGLDPFPYNGCTTTCEALWMGIPVVTLAGVMSYGRFGVSLLSNLGLDEFIASTPEAYVTKAVSLAKNRKRLATLRADLRPRMAGSTLCDAKALAQGIERAYRDMWRRWCRS